MGDPPDASSFPLRAPDAEGRDLFLSFNSLDREQVQTVRRLLEARKVTTFLDRENLLVGQPWFDALENAIETARGMAVFIGKDGIGRWQKRELALALDRQSREEQAGGAFPVVPVLLPQADLEKAPGFLLLNTFVDLRGKIDDSNALNALVRAVRGEAPPPAQTPAALCPYRGLRVFREEDAPLFFGREVFAEELRKKALAHPLVTVVGPSGSGKSSVVQAGLLPLLRRERPPDPTWEAAIFTPGKRPFHSLAAALVPLWEAETSETQRLIEAEELGNRLASGTVAVEAAIEQALRKSSGTNRLLLVVDQFEELFTLTPEAERRGFVDALLRAATDRPVTVVLTLRADFYGQAIGLSRDLSDGMPQALVNLGPMTRDELRRAVEKPAGVVGLNFEPGLVDRILDDVEGQPGSLPLLEFALTELWERREDASLTHRKYDEIGRVEGAISQRAEEQFARLSPEQQKVALRVFARLVRVSSAQEEGMDTRQRVRLDALDSPARAVVQSFVAARLLVTGRREGSDEETTIEVAHEALIRNWDRVGRLLNENREFLLWRQRLGLRLSEWERTQRDAGALLRGVALNEARRWVRERPQDLNEPEHAFIQSSDEAERAIIRSSELAVRRRRRFLAVGASVVALLVIGVTWYVTWWRSPANQIRLILAEGTKLVSRSSVFVDEWVRALSFAGRSEAALAAAQKIEDPYRRSWALASAVEALAKAGQTEAAKKAAQAALLAAQKVKKPSDRYLALNRVAQALVEAGQSEAALAAAQKIEDPSDRSRTLASMLKALVEAGQSETALAIARKIHDPSLRSWVLANMVETLLVKPAGQSEAALPVAQKVEDPFLRSRAFAFVTYALAKAGQSEAAKKAAQAALLAAQKVEDPYDRSSALSGVVGVVEALARTGQSEAARKAARAALLAAQKVEDPSRRSLALASVVEALARTGQSEAALAIAQKIEDPSTRSSALARVAEALAKAGQSKAALAIARKIEDPYPPFSALALVVKALVKAGQSEAALAAAQKVEDPYRRSSALASAVEALAGAGQTEAAKKAAQAALLAAQKVKDSYNRSSALNGVVEALARAGQSEAALAIARKIEDPSARSSALARVVKALAKAGQSEAARKVAEKITDDQERSRSFAHVAEALARSKLFYQAREMADLRDVLPDDRLRAYAAILREYTKKQGGEIAKVIAAEEKESEKYFWISP